VITDFTNKSRFCIASSDQREGSRGLVDSKDSNNRWSWRLFRQSVLGGQHKEVLADNASLVPVLGVSLWLTEYSI